MKKEILELKVNPFLDRFGFYSVKCIEKNESMVSESIRTYSLYYYLLFKEIRYGLLKDTHEQPEEFIREHTNIKFDLHFAKTDNFLADMRKFLDNEERLILITDNFYEDDDPHFYQIKHHIHFFIPKGYDTLANTYTIINQDYSYILNFKSGARCIEKKVSGEKLTNLCCYVKSLEELKSHGRDIGPDLSEGFYAYVIATDESKGVKSCDLEKLTFLYQKQITELVNRANKIEEWFTEDFQSFIQNFDKNSARTGEGVLFYTDISNLNTPEMTRINDHTQSLNSQRQFFEFKMEPGEKKDHLIKLFNNVINTYGLVLALSRKGLEGGDKTVLDKLLGYLKGVAQKETQLYEAIITAAEKTISNPAIYN